MKTPTIQNVSKKRQLFNKGLDILYTKIAKAKPVLIDSLVLPEDKGILRVYMVGKFSPKYKLVYTDSSDTIIHYLPRLLTDRRPVEELASGIHDNALMRLTGIINHRYFIKGTAAYAKRKYQ